MYTLLVLTAVVAADASPTCLVYCNSLLFRRIIPWPVNCDCQSPPTGTKRQDHTDISITTILPESKIKYYEYIQKSFSTRNQKGYNIHNEENTGFNKIIALLKEKSQASNQHRMHAIGTIGINEKSFTECIFLQLIMSKRKLNNAEYYINLKSDEINNYKLSDIELIEKINEKCNKATYSYNISHQINVIHNFSLKKDHFKAVTSTENAENNIHVAETVSISPVHESSAFTELPQRSPTIISSTEQSNEITTIQLNKEHNINLTKNMSLSTVSKYETSQSPEEIVTEFNVPVNLIESSGTLTNITTTTENAKNKTILNMYNTSIHSLYDLINTTTDYPHLGSYKLSNKIQSTSQMSTDKSILKVVDVKLLNNKNYKETANETDTKLTTNNDTAKFEILTGNQLQDERFLQTFNNLSKNYNDKGYDINTNSFRRKNNHRDGYDESNIPIVRIITQEYPNDTVSSIINGIEILPNDDFKDKINESKPYDVDFKTQGAKINKVYSISVNYKGKQTELKSTKKLLKEKAVYSRNIKGKLFFISGEQKIPARFVQEPDGNIQIGLDIL